jgi:hypothetical protein
MSATKMITAVGVATLLLASACGDDPSPLTPVNPPAGPTLPNLTGSYNMSWLMQVLRTSDSFMTSFNCGGSMTLLQSGSELTGFAVVGSGCPPLSFPVRGRVMPGGSIEFRTGGPKPPEGPCPGVAETDYTGVFTGNNRISARGSGTVVCPQFGTHVFTYIVSAIR